MQCLCNRKTAAIKATVTFEALSQDGVRLLGTAEVHYSGGYCSLCYDSIKPSIGKLQRETKLLDNFKDAWAKLGYQYGDDALEQVKLGWDLAVKTFGLNQRGSE